MRGRGSTRAGPESEILGLQQSSWDTSFSSLGRTTTHEVSHQWAPCNRNIKPHLIHLRCPFSLKGEWLSVHPSVSLHDPLELSWRNHPSDSDIFKTQVHFSKVEMSEWPLLIPLSLTLSLAHPLLPCYHFYLLSPNSIFFFWFYPSFENVAAPCLPLVATSLGCTDHCLSPMCCMCLVVSLIMHGSHDPEQTGPGLAT